MRKALSLALVAVVCLALPGCAIVGANPADKASKATETISAYVISPSPDGEEEVILCEEGADEPIPPNCKGTGTPVQGWDWDAVPYETADTDPITRFGHYTVTFERLSDGSVRVDMDEVQDSGHVSG